MTRMELMIYAEHKYDMALSKHTFITYERLNSCQAHYVDLGSSVILKSYDTIVAIYHRKTGSLYVFNYYSATTSQHISKLAKKLRVFRIVYLYERSDGVIEKMMPGSSDELKYKPTKQEWKNLHDFDFSMEITSKWD